MRAKRIFNFIAASLMVLPFLLGLLGTGNEVEAQNVLPPTEGNVNVTLHKRAFDEMPGLTQNTGNIMADFGGEPLSGVEFTVYDVTEEYHRLINNSTQQAAIDAIVADSTNAVPNYATSLDSGTTGENGELTFENLPLKAESKDAVYLFLETGTPIEVREKAAPIVLAMPIYSGETLNTDIHLYPKNVTKVDSKEITSTFEKITIGGVEYDNVNIGDVIDYAITIHVPQDIAYFSDFIVEDIPSAGLELVLNSITLPAGLNLGQDYTIEGTTAGFEITFDTSQGIQNFAGSPITINYSMTLTGNIDPDDIFDNKANLTLGENTTLIPGPGVVTGGHQFIKTDAHTQSGLAGAEFVVKNSAGEYANFEVIGGEYIFTGTWSPTQTDNTTIVSGADGFFNIKGFVDGTYTLEETKAPSGYVKSGDIEFVITHGQYGNTNLRTTVANTPRGLLPATGGSGILIFLAIGIGLMLGALVWYKNYKNRVEA